MAFLSEAIEEEKQSVSPKFLRRLVRVEQAVTTLTQLCVFGGHGLELAATSDSKIDLFTSDYITQS